MLGLAVRLAGRAGRRRRSLAETGRRQGAWWPPRSSTPTWPRISARRVRFPSASANISCVSAGHRVMCSADGSKSPSKPEDHFRMNSPRWAPAARDEQEGSSAKGEAAASRSALSAARPQRYDASLGSANLGGSEALAPHRVVVIRAQVGFQGRQPARQGARPSYGYNARSRSTSRSCSPDTAPARSPTVATKPTMILNMECARATSAASSWICSPVRKRPSQPLACERDDPLLHLLRSDRADAAGVEFREDVPPKPA